MDANKYFWATVFSSVVFLTGLVGLSIKGFYPAYHAFLQFCGLPVETCHAVIDSLSPMSVIGAAVAIWLAVVLVWQLVRTKILVDRVTSAELERPNFLETMIFRLGLSGQVRLVRDNVLFCSGLLSPKIIIGRSVIQTLSRRELEAALRHEAWHLRERDPLKVLISSSLSRALFFLPMIGALAKSYSSEKELAADRFAEDLVGRTYLARALYKVLTKFNPEPAILPGYVAGFAAVRGDNPKFSRAFGWSGVLTIGFSTLMILLAISTHPVAAARCL